MGVGAGVGVGVGVPWRWLAPLPALLPHGRACGGRVVCGSRSLPRCSPRGARSHRRRHLPREVRENHVSERTASRRAGCSSGSITLTHPVRNRYPWAQAAALALDDAAAGSPRRRRAGVDASTVEPRRSARARRARPVLGSPPSREPSVAGRGASAPVTPPPAATTAPRGNAAGLRPVWCAAPGCCAGLGRHLDGVCKCLVTGGGLSALLLSHSVPVGLVSIKKIK